MSITKQQNSILHGLLSANRLMDQKETLVQTFTAGRSKSSKDLTFQEAGELITHLKAIDSGHKMRRKIIKLAHEMGWKQPGGKIDLHAIDTWCLTYGFGKKRLNQYTNQELPKLVTQFENGPYKHYLHNF
ncbi:MAG: hypothetical protein EOO01_33165 [Chitinophagaceae bacterium]|nr:MAG: hypothetical protein EOO01_33165 [Chitinophagaceae bacterium]